MFLKTRSPIDQEDRDWQVECWRWLLSNFGGLDAIYERPFVLPTPEYFHLTDCKGHGKAQEMFENVARLMSIDPGLFELVPQEEAINPHAGDLAVVQNVPTPPAGTFQSGNGELLRISYDPSSVSKPEMLVATLAHDISHAVLFTTDDEPPGGPDCEEFATDLAVTFFGLGLFGANSAFEFTQFSDGAIQGWSTQRLGYLTEAEWGFSLAVFMQLREQPEQLAQKYLKPSIVRHLNKSSKYLKKNPQILDHIKSYA